MANHYATFENLLLDENIIPIRCFNLDEDWATLERGSNEFSQKKEDPPLQQVDRPWTY